MSAKPTGFYTALLDGNKLVVVCEADRSAHAKELKNVRRYSRGKVCFFCTQQRIGKGQPVEMYRK
jgi:hypothetical protein